MKPLSFSSSVGSRPLGARSMGGVYEGENAASVEFALSGRGPLGGRTPAAPPGARRGAAAARPGPGAGESRGRGSGPAGALHRFLRDGHDLAAGGADGRGGAGRVDLLREDGDGADVGAAYVGG